MAWAATASHGTSIAALRLYVDNVSRYTVHSAQLSTSVALSPGSHLLAVVAYETNGHTLKSTETITVPSARSTDNRFFALRWRRARRREELSDGGHWSGIYSQ